MSDSWNGRRVLVTGATGMIGSWLVKDLLAGGAEVAVLVRDADPQSELFRSGDLSRAAVVSGSVEEFATVERAVSEREPETVFHLAAQPLVGLARRSPLPTFETNVLGTVNVLEACRLHAGLVRRIVLASSDKAYGESARLPYTEDQPLLGGAPYEASKSCADLAAQSYASTFGLPVGIVRCGNVFGGGDLNFSRIVPGTIRSLLRGERPVIRSDGTFVRDYLYVKDVSRAYLRLAERLDDPKVRGGAFNFSLERPLAVLDLVRIIQDLIGKEPLVPDVRNEAGGEIRSQFLSAAKARSLLGWRPEFTLEEGLKETIAWYRKFLGPADPSS